MGVSYDSLVTLSENLKGTLTISDKIRIASAVHGVDADVALNIACVESGLNEKAKNPYSSASGVYQWLDSTWKHYGLKYWGSLENRDKMDPDDSIELAMRVISDVGTSDWNSSKWSGVGGGWASNPTKRGYCPE